MAVKWARRICLAAIIGVLAAGISHEMIASDEHLSKGNAVLVMAQARQEDANVNENDK